MCTMIPGNHAMFSANNGPSMGHVDHGSSMTSAAAFWQARHMAVATSGGHTHGSTGANFGHHAHIHNHQHHHDAKMAEKIVSELQVRRPQEVITNLVVARSSLSKVSGQALSPEVDAGRMNG